MNAACLAPSSTFDYTQIFEDIAQERVNTDITIEDYDPRNGELPDPGTYDAVIVSGSGEHVYDGQDWVVAAERYLATELADGVPVMGVCYGHQLVAATLGEEDLDNVAPIAETDELPEDDELLTNREMGYRHVELTDAGRESVLFADVPDRFMTFESHEDHVADVPDEVRVLAENTYGVQAIESTEHPAYGVQFHPEYNLGMAETLLESKDGLALRERVDIAATLTEENDGRARQSRQVFDNFWERIVDGD